MGQVGDLENMRKGIVILGIILLILISTGCVQEDLSRAGPGGCRSEEECRTYCETHQEECQRWSEQNKGGMLKGFQGKAGPGGCQSEEECKAYCREETNREECKKWFDEMEGSESHEGDIEQSSHKEIPPEGGPGGCQTEAECGSYCSQEENQEECQRWSQEHKG